MDQIIRGFDLRWRLLYHCIHKEKTKNLNSNQAIIKMLFKFFLHFMFSLFTNYNTRQDLPSSLGPFHCWLKAVSEKHCLLFHHLPSNRFSPLSNLLVVLFKLNLNLPHCNYPQLFILINFKPYPTAKIAQGTPIYPIT